LFDDRVFAVVFVRLHRFLSFTRRTIRRSVTWSAFRRERNPEGSVDMRCLLAGQFSLDNPIATSRSPYFIGFALSAPGVHGPAVGHRRQLTAGSG
jgi:hypothetical protein